MKRIIWTNLGLIDFREADALQKAIRDTKIERDGPEVFLFLEHPTIITSGRRERPDELTCDMQILNERKIELIKTDRGGGYTVHAPGQLVCYVILDIAKWGGVKGVIHLLEELMIRVLASYSVSGSRKKDHPGVWVGNERIGFIGLSVKKGVTAHGLAFNVTNSLVPFSFIVPCGVRDKEVTSLKKLTGKDYSLRDVRDRFLIYLEDVTGLEPKYVEPEVLKTGKWTG